MRTACRDDLSAIALLDLDCQPPPSAAFQAGASWSVGMTESLQGILTAEDARVAQASVELQDALRSRIAAALAQYPTSYLYEDEQDCPEELQIRGFQELLRRVRTTLQVSPRTENLKALSRKFQAAVVPGSPMAELYELLSLRHGAAAMAVAQAVDAVKPSRLYLQWQAACQATNKPDATDGREEEIRKGLCKKALQKGLPVPSEEELEKQLSKIARSGADRGAEHRERAEKLRNELQTDSQHLKWQRVQRLWRESGGEELLAQYQALDRQQGDARRLHGGLFEAVDARCAEEPKHVSFF